MTAKFLCCLPLRLGVLIFTFLQFLLGGAAAALLWYVFVLVRTAKTEDGTEIWDAVPLSIRVVIIVLASIYSLACIAGLFGFFGAICKKTGFVRTYFTLLSTVFLLQIASSIWYLVAFYQARGQSDSVCAGGNPPADQVAYCSSLEQVKAIPQGWVIVAAIVPVVVMAYAIYVVHFYIKRLDDKKAEKEHRQLKSGNYASVNSKDESYPLTHPHVSQPYTDSASVAHRV